MIVYKDDLVEVDDNPKIPLKVLDEDALKIAISARISIWKAKELIDYCETNGHNWDKKTFIDANIWKCKKCHIQYDLDDGKYY